MKERGRSNEIPQTAPVPVSFPNLDGKVDVMDLNALAQHWLQTGQSWATGDFTGDHIVNQLDLSVLAQHWQWGVVW